MQLHHHLMEHLTANLANDVEKRNKTNKTEAHDHNQHRRDLDSRRVVRVEVHHVLRHASHPAGSATGANCPLADGSGGWSSGSPRWSASSAARIRARLAAASALRHFSLLPSFRRGGLVLEPLKITKSKYRSEVSTSPSSSVTLFSRNRRAFSSSIPIL